MATIRNIVLVHGGFVDGSGWQGVYDHLTADGYRVAVVQNPTLSLAGDVASTRQVLDGLGSPAVLVSHSYGGATNVKALVHIAALVPDQGEQLSVLINKYPGSIIEAATRPVAYDGTPGTDPYLEADTFRAAFAADLPIATTPLMQAAQRPFGASCFTDATAAVAWRTIPPLGTGRRRRPAHATG
ncbi:alpha/beta fold hydrolase [Streptomyces sp. NPDC059496]|uniref:alpha/beta fold hydrolase n=1 Tax=Streptomyces sp. NPDC059496 TaxID=3346851 RepID=UPI0036951EE1